jgi:hypothetical protein
MSSPAWTLGSWVRIPLEAWMFVFILCVCCPVAALRRADHSSKESYQLSLSVRLRNLIRGGLGPIWAGAPNKKKNYMAYECIRMSRWTQPKYVLSFLFLSGLNSILEIVSCKYFMLNESPNMPIF